MRVLITGANGQLGTDLMAECAKRGIDTIGTDVKEMDITDAQAVERVMKDKMQETPYDAVIHCAAYVAVDKAEDEPEQATSGRQTTKASNRQTSLEMFFFMGGPLSSKALGYPPFVVFR